MIAPVFQCMCDHSLGAQRLPRLIGASRAKELCFTGRRVSAETAAQIGLVDHVVSEGRAYEK
eukprot:1157862-Pelagomonas_calceolata.AAC.2